MTPPCLYKPHLFKSVVHPGLWACVAKRPSRNPRRAIEPVPDAPIVYGANKYHAYERWLVYSKL